jgi:branched-subunit amino acid transport protein
MALVTYIPRLLPIAIFTKVEAPKLFIAWLKYVPVAVLAALLTPGLLMEGNRLNISLTNYGLLAAIPCFIVSFKYRNMFVTIITGLAVITMLTYLRG